MKEKAKVIFRNFILPFILFQGAIIFAFGAVMLVGVTVMSWIMGHQRADEWKSHPVGDHLRDKANREGARSIKQLFGAISQFVKAFNSIHPEYKVYLGLQVLITVAFWGVGGLIVSQFRTPQSMATATTALSMVSMMTHAGFATFWTIREWPKTAKAVSTANQAGTTAENKAA